MDELGPHGDRLETLVAEDGERPAPYMQPSGAVGVPRRLQALAASVAGQSTLLALLEQGSGRLPAAQGITALHDALMPQDEGWQRLLPLSRKIALNPERTVAERCAADRVVRRDGRALTSTYTEEFVQSALQSGESDLVSGAMCNMALIGKASTCYKVLQARLGDLDPAKRREYATVLASVATFQRERKQRLPAPFYTALDKVLSDSDLEVRAVGIVAVAFLLGTDTWIPTSYVRPLVETALESRNPSHLEVTCLALCRLTKSDYRPPYPHASGSEFSAWVRGHSAEVREHLRNWYAAWQERQWERDQPRDGDAQKPK